MQPFGKPSGATCAAGERLTWSACHPGAQLHRRSPSKQDVRHWGVGDRDADHGPRSCSDPVASAGATSWRLELDFREGLVTLSIALASGSCARPPPHPDFIPQAIASKPAPVQTECPNGMALVHGGTLAQESGDTVELPSFCMSRTEVTVEAYLACVATESCTLAGSEVTSNDLDGATLAFFSRFCNADREERRDHPVNCVTHAQASAFCTATKGRLPTAHEWEWAARGGEEARSLPWGEEPPSARRVNACGLECKDAFEALGRTHKTMFVESDTFVGTSPVGAFPEGASRDDLRDLVGNVSEWTSSDRAAETAEVVGGAWSSATPELLLPSGSRMVPRDTRDGSVGFRCVATPHR